MVKILTYSHYPYSNHYFSQIYQFEVPALKWNACRRLEAAFEGWQTPPADSDTESHFRHQQLNDLPQQDHCLTQMARIWARLRRHQGRMNPLGAGAGASYYSLSRYRCHHSWGEVAGRGCHHEAWQPSRDQLILVGSRDCCCHCCLYCPPYWISRRWLVVLLISLTSTKLEYIKNIKNSLQK